jgi:hypothetical protein
MTAKALLIDLETKGVLLTVREDRLCYVSPREALTPSVIDVLRARREALLLPVATDDAERQALLSYGLIRCSQCRRILRRERVTSCRTLCPFRWSGRRRDPLENAFRAAETSCDTIILQVTAARSANIIEQLLAVKCNDEGQIGLDHLPAAGQEVGEINAIKKQDWTLLAVALAGGQPLSPVQLQKSVFLLQELLPSDQIAEENYEFVPHNYGPFCSEVYADASALADAGLVSIVPVPGERYTEYVASPTCVRQGEALARTLHPEVSGYARRIVDWVRSQSFRSLVSAIYERYPQYRVNSIFRG